MKINDIVKFQDAFKLRRGMPKSAMLAVTMVLALMPALLAQQPAPSPAFLPSPVQTVSTIPSNGDVNPYGVAFVPAGFPAGALNPGDVLVSNFNNNQNLQGTGSTIVRVPQGGSPSLVLSVPTSLHWTLHCAGSREGRLRDRWQLSHR